MFRFTFRLALSVVVGLSISATFTSTRLALACTLYQGTGQYGFRGGYQIPSQSPWMVSAAISTSNPSPVWTWSGIWVMLEHSSLQWAQVGYTHVSGASTSGIDFADWIDNGGYEHDVYGSFPSGTETYSVTREASTPWYLCDSLECFQTNATLTWAPDTIEIESELHSWGGSTNGVTNGDHAVGYPSSHVHVTNAIWAPSSGISTATNLNYSPGSPGPAPYQAISTTNGANFDTWDSRC